MICTEYAYKHVSFLCDPKGSGPGRACDACSVSRCSV